MTADRRKGLRSLEGRLVHLSLVDGSRLDEVTLVSARTDTLWIFTNGEDVFVRVDSVVDAWEAQSSRSAA